MSNYPISPNPQTAQKTILFAFSSDYLKTPVSENHSAFPQVLTLPQP